MTYILYLQSRGIYLNRQNTEASKYWSSTQTYRYQYVCKHMATYRWTVHNILCNVECLNNMYIITEKQPTHSLSLSFCRKEHMFELHLGVFLQQQIMICWICDRLVWFYYATLLSITSAFTKYIAQSFLFWPHRRLVRWWTASEYLHFKFFILSPQD